MTFSHAAIRPVLEQNNNWIWTVRVNHKILQYEVLQQVQLEVSILEVLYHV